MKVFVVGVIQVLTWTVSKNVYPFFRVYGLTEKKELLSTPLREKASHQSTSKSSFCVPCRLVHEESSKWCGFFFSLAPGTTIVVFVVFS